MFITIEGRIAKYPYNQATVKSRAKENIYNQYGTSHGVCNYHYAFVLACFSCYTGI